jgi:acyl transferase domain-containing protein
VDAITDVADDRWDTNTFYDSARDKLGKLYVRKGGFLPEVDHFEPGFFGISPREASSMDPQQRLLLEVTWEALEDAGIPPESMAGQNIAVYVGLFMHDYENMHMGVTERALIGPHSPTGMSTTIAANRLSYVFDFRGPSAVIDTACSSSLYAVHMACQSLLCGESPLALAGGVNLLLRPEMSMALCRGSFLSEEGYCKSFVDASADGYVRSEGCGMVALKTLSRARQDGDSIYALIRGTAINQDGPSRSWTQLADADWRRRRP